MTDSAQIDALIAAFFRGFDNRNERVPSAAALEDLFVAGATISQHKGDECELADPRGFVAPRIRLLTDGSVAGFHEWETGSTTEIVGPIATRVSRYAKAGTMNGADCGGQGTKVFQLVRLRAGWRIAALSWFDHAPL